MPSNRARYRKEPRIEPVPHGSSTATHDHKVSDWAGRLTGVCLALVCVLGWQQWQLSDRLTASEEYIAEARTARDRQNAELERLVYEEAREVACSFLDRLPAGPLWDGSREIYRCGPGLDPAAFTPGEVEQLLRSYGVASFPTTSTELYDLIPPQIGAAP